MGVGAIVGAIAGGVAASTAASVAIATGISIGFSVGRAYDNYKESKEFQESMNQSSNSPTYSFGPISNTKSHQVPVPVVYGRNLVAGNIVNQKIHGKNGRYMDIQVGISEGPIEAIEEVKADDNDIKKSVTYNKEKIYEKKYRIKSYWQDQLRWIPSYNEATEEEKEKYYESYQEHVDTVTHYDYEVKLGNRDQSAWEKNENEQTFPYLAHYSATLDAERTKASGVPTMTAIVKGRKVRMWTGSIWVTRYSNNPAWCVLDFLTNNRFGFGVSEAFIDLETFKEVAQYANQKVDGEKRFELDFVIDAKSSALDILNEMLSTFRAFLIWSDGKLKLKVDKPDVASQSFVFSNDKEKDNIISGSFARRGSSRKERLREVVVEYTDPDENFETIGARFIDNSVPGESSKTITMNGINRFSQAGREARYYQKKSKLCTQIISFGASINDIEAEIGDKILVTHIRPGWVDKPFKIMEISESEEHNMSITAVEYNEAIYTDDGIVQQGDYGSTLPNPLEPPEEVSELSISEYGYSTPEGNHAANITIDFVIPDDSRFKYAQILVSIDGGEYQNRGTTDNNNFQLQNVKINSNYEVKVQTVSKYQGITSDGVTSEEINISGKDNKPKSPNSLVVAQNGSSVVFKWSRVQEPDVLGYEIREGPDWSGGRLIATDIPGENYTTDRETDGTKKYLIKTIDRIRQYSNDSASKIFTVENSGNKLNIINERDELAAADGNFQNLYNLNNEFVFPHNLSFSDFPDQSFFNPPAELESFPDVVLDANYTSAAIDTGKKGRTGIRISRSIFATDDAGSMSSMPDSSFSDYQNYSFADPATEYHFNISVQFSDDNNIWSEWQEFMPGEYSFKYCKFKIEISAISETADINANKFIEILDVPDIVLEIESLAVDQTGTTINFADYNVDFYRKPKGYRADIINDGTLKFPVFDSKNKDSVIIKLFDAAGEQVSGTAEDIIIRGY